MFTQEEFVKYINAHKANYERTCKFTDAIALAFDGFPVYQLDDILTASYVDMLKVIMKDTTRDSWIEYFIYELDYGVKYKEGSIIEKDGTFIDLSTPEKLYDFLILNLNSC